MMSGEVRTMPVYLRHNAYRGVNAHLMSFFQTYDGWEGFHNKHIGDLGAFITRILPDGYVVDTEKSLQLLEIHPDTGERVRRPKPDATLYQYERSAMPQRAPSAQHDASATLVQPIIATIDLLEELMNYSALLIYRLQPDAILGQPLTRIELLSPTNKFGDGYLQYSEKRIATFKSGLNLVEIDYLHETDPVVKGVPSYARREVNAYPYHITISHPLPTLQAGKATTYGFGIDVPIPTLNIPLDDDNTFVVDFNAVYHLTYESMKSYSLRVDYGQQPAHFDAYTPDDQARIIECMGRVSR
jgi:Protein of unknown function (DUF4058)